MHFTKFIIVGGRIESRLPIQVDELPSETFEQARRALTALRSSMVGAMYRIPDDETFAVGLGRYFGTDRPVLTVDTPHSRESRLELWDDWVIRERYSRFFLWRPDQVPGICGMFHLLPVDAEERVRAGLTGLLIGSLIRSSAPKDSHIPDHEYIAADVETIWATRPAVVCFSENTPTDIPPAVMEVVSAFVDGFAAAMLFP